jgi:indolepyruvate ferredoxin oxidoreductase beta subunit
MEAAARETGTIVSAVMFGAIAASAALPFGREHYEAVVRASGRGAEASIKGFARGWDAVRDAASPSLRGAGQHAGEQTAERAAPPGEPGVGAFPVEARGLIALGHARLVAFQDRAYAGLYLERLARVMAAERASDPHGNHGFALTRETGRFLALWMAFDDIVRVAGLKCRASRFARVRSEVAARDGDIVRIVDYFKPGIPEFAGMLPPLLATRLGAWDRARQTRGKAPAGFAVHLRSDTISGFLMLRMLAGLQRWRRRGARYVQEQALIERWLAAIERAAGDGWQSAFEIALCGRLIKGYGATNERGKRNLVHIVDHLAAVGTFANEAARATAIRQAREAALADEGGKAFDQALVAHGAPARPAVAQPIRWTKKRAGTVPAPSTRLDKEHAR